MADLSKLSTEDLLALKAGDLARVSTPGLQALRTAQVAEQIDNDPISTGARNFAKDMPAGQQFAAGAGKALIDISRGAAQMVGAGPTAEETAEQRKTDAPLMDTGAGVAGNVVGNVLALAPAALIPGANTVAGAAVLGAGIGALQPTQGPGERLKNMATGGAIGGGAQWLGTTGARMLGHRAAERNAATAAAQQQNAVRDTTLEAGQAAGYVVPPSAVNPSFWNKRAESIAGKAAVGQEAAGRNQTVTNRLASEALGLPPATPITEQVLEQVRNAAAQPYRDVSKLMGVDLLEQLKQARFEAKAQWKFYERSANPEALTAAKALTHQADQLEQAMEAFARAAGKPELVASLREARTLIAKTYDVERALNTATGDVSARVLSNRPNVTGPLATAGEFYKAFPSYARDGAKIPTPGVSKAEALASLAFGMGGAGIAGPAGVVAGALPLASGPVRSMVLSKPYQRAMAAPAYGKALNISPEDMALMARSLALPAAASHAGTAQ